MYQRLLDTTPTTSKSLHVTYTAASHKTSGSQTFSVVPSVDFRHCKSYKTHSLIGLNKFIYILINSHISAVIPL